MRRRLPRRRHDDATTTHRYVPPGGYSTTIKGLVKIALGLVIRAGGWLIPVAQQSEIIDVVTTLVVLVLEVWGVGQVYGARQSRGDIDLLGKRVAPVEVIVSPETPPAVSREP